MSVAGNNFKFLQNEICRIESLSAFAGAARRSHETPPRRPRARDHLRPPGRSRRTWKSIPRKSPTCCTTPPRKTCWWICPWKTTPRSKRLALVQEVQHHPLSAKVVHVDLHEVAENEKVTVSGPGGNHRRSGRRQERRRHAGTRHAQAQGALPAERFAGSRSSIDVTALEIGKSIHLGRHCCAGRRGNFGREAPAPSWPWPRRAPRKKWPQPPPLRPLATSK